MTVLLVSPTTEGLIIGADGRASIDSGVKISDEDQKIFFGRNNSNHFICSLIGLTAFRPMGQETQLKRKYDFVKSLTDGIHLLEARRFTSPFDYLVALSFHVRDEIANAKTNDRFYDLPSNQPLHNGNFFVSHIVMAGYWEGRQFAKYSILTHRNQIMNEAITVKDMMDEIFLGHPYISHGETHLFKMAAYDQEERLLKYKPGLTLPFGDSLREACVFTCTYLELCCDETIRDLDPSLIRVGGHIHIASVTPNRVDWIRRPKKLLVTV